MLIDAMHTLFDYNTWANGRVFDEASKLNPHQFTMSEDGMFSSVHQTLFHMVNAQEMWLARCQETASPRHEKMHLFSDYLKLRRYWERVDLEMHAFLHTLDEVALQRIIHYVNPQEEANAYPLWQLLYHQLNHAAQHRSEVAMVLTHFGHSPGWLDFPYYLDLQEGTTLHLNPKSIKRD